MSKYIDSEKLIAEIKEKIAEIEKEPAPADRETILLQMCKINAFREVLSVINRLKKNSLQQEQPEVNLEEEITRFFSENPIPYEHITDWPLLKNTAIHFYELGLNARKEEQYD